MSFTISTLTLEAFLLVLVRVACFISIAPVFGHNSLNTRMKISIAFFVSLILYQVVDVSLPVYSDVLGYSTLVLEEALVGLLLGFVAGLSMKALAIAGEFIDREIGFSMATTFDPNQGMVTITGELYDKIVCLVIMISNLHYYILSAAAQSFELVPVGRIVLNPDLIYTSLIQFIVQVFMIGFRIAMPVFLGATMLNVILGVLAKSSPQMNMFAIGMQLKVFVGLFLLAVCIMFVPNIANYIMERMRDMIQTILGGL
ncbi:flagellar biosynthetic protein FliR [Eubacterium sp. MSJ-33]|uniref:flagellar biosynthetic protein FliR n=1 Tax=Eubacterium sp. MSJ-33 TaxID=2841528 RepID=UPI001C74146D|nr:flagellar biosynthetic protein FliR [Eubacterium sp. MSJ-33]QWT53447.1 flagellar biosynthetic protein FliR [Eubacterium sp. MSJ-33]